MWRLLHVKRIIVLSPEMVVALAVLAVWVYAPQSFSVVTSALETDGGFPEFVGVLPVGLVLASYRLGVAVLRPGEESENRILYEWPAYWALEARVFGSGFLCLICVVIYWANHMNLFGLAPDAVGLVAVLSVGIPVTSVVSLAIAKLAIRKILTLYG